jgi:hypothetical protein
MIDLNYFVRHYNPWSPHHIAAFNELAKHIPKDQLNRDADWVTIYKEESTEWQPDELSF